MHPLVRDQTSRHVFAQPKEGKGRSAAMPAVNPEIMKWARERAGMSLEEAAHAIGVNDAKGRTGAERLSAIETGSEEPSQRQLFNMAQKYRRSLLIFYLDVP